MRRLYLGSARGPRQRIGAPNGAPKHFGWQKSHNIGAQLITVSRARKLVPIFHAKHCRPPAARLFLLAPTFVARILLLASVFQVVFVRTPGPLGRHHTAAWAWPALAARAFEPYARAPHPPTTHRASARPLLRRPACNWPAGSRAPHRRTPSVKWGPFSGAPPTRNINKQQHLHLRRIFSSNLKTSAKKAGARLEGAAIGRPASSILRLRTFCTPFHLCRLPGPRLLLSNQSRPSSSSIRAPGACVILNFFTRTNLSIKPLAGDLQWPLAPLLAPIRK